MIAKIIFYVAASRRYGMCDLTVAATTEKRGYAEQEVVYRPVEEVWPDVVPQKPRSNPKTPTKNKARQVKSGVQNSDLCSTPRGSGHRQRPSCFRGVSRQYCRGSRYKVFTTSFRNTARTMLSGLPAIT